MLWKMIFSELETLIENAKKGILDEAIKAVESKSVVNSDFIQSVIENQMNEIRNKLDETKQNSSEFTNITIKYTNSYLQSKITDILSEGKLLSLDEISAKTNMSKASLGRALERLHLRNIVTYEDKGNVRLYGLNSK